MTPAALFAVGNQYVAPPTLDSPPQRLLRASSCRPAPLKRSASALQEDPHVLHESRARPAPARSHT